MAQAPNQTIAVINGPNLNLLGEREPHIYGTLTLAELNASLTELAASAGFDLICYQSNHEGDLIDQVQAMRLTTGALIINPGGYAHTSVALRDALAAYPHPILEVHISNVYRREAFRHQSYLSAVVTGVICGLGADGYRLALQSLIETLRTASLDRAI